MLATLQKRTCNPNSSPKSQGTVIRNKAKHVKNHLHVITRDNEWLSERVLMCVATGKGFRCLREDEVQLSMTDVLVIKDFVGCSTNQMVRMKRILEACLDFMKIFPTCLCA